VNQLNASSFREVGNTRHKTSSSEVKRLTWVANVSRCSLGSVVSSYVSKFGFLQFARRGAFTTSSVKGCLLMEGRRSVWVELFVLCLDRGIRTEVLVPSRSTVLSGPFSASFLLNSKFSCFILSISSVFLFLRSSSSFLISNNKDVASTWFSGMVREDSLLIPLRVVTISF